jgi:FkbM family methyltransferase
MIRKAIKSALRIVGYDIHKIRDPYLNAASRLGHASVVFDIGANVGQSALRLRQVFPDSTIHCFEPSPKTFAALRDNIGQRDRFVLNQYAVGSQCGALQLHEHDTSQLSSLLPMGPDGYSPFSFSTEVPVITLDEYCARSGVEQIDFLKIDTQGYDHQVLLGALPMLERHRIRLILAELIFSRMYGGAVRCEETISLLAQRGYRTIDVYTEESNWADFLFAVPDITSPPT